MSVKEDLPKIPDGHISAVEIDEAANDQADVVHVTIKSDQGDDNKVKFDKQFFGTSLVFYCQGSGIPLPRGGTKNVLFGDDKVVMKVAMG